MDVITWFKVDDSFYRSRKVRRLGADRVCCVGLWTLCGDWSADNLTDGFVPWEVVEDWDQDRSWAARLIEVALWFETEHDGELGIRFHDWDDWQPTKEQVIQRRKADAERRARWRDARRNGGTPAGFTEPSPSESRQESREESRRDTDDVSREESRPGSALPDPTRPDPTRKEEETSSSTPASAAADKARPEVEELCKHLRDRIVANGRKAPTSSEANGWRNQARLLLDRDKRDPAEAHRLIDWCQDDGFWRSNIGGMPKFRKQYDSLRLRAQAEGGRHLASVPLTGGGATPYSNPTDQSVYDEPMYPTQETS